MGERGPAPKEVPTYPEISLHSIEDLDILSSREKVSFAVDEKVKDLYRDEIIPYWNGKSNRDRIMGLMTPEWLNAYNAGLFHRIPGAESTRTYCAGLQDVQYRFLKLKEEIRQTSLLALDF